MQTAEQIAAGLEGMDYVRACTVCGGKGSYRQTYNAGCGMGYYTMNGPCAHCDETGFIYLPTGKAPPASVLRQIAARALLKEQNNEQQ